MSVLAATAIQSGLNVGSGIIDNLYAKRNLKMQTDANKELAKYSYGKDMEMWHLQNQYNNPKSQMQRFSEAGLNPNLIYGQGNPGNATTSPKYNTPTAGLLKTKSPKMDIIPQYQNLRMQNAQIQNTEANTNLTNEQTKTQESVGTMKLIDAELKNIDLAYWQGYNDQWKGKGPFGQKYGNRFQLHRQKQQSQLRAYQLQSKKQELIDANINLTLQNLATKQRQYRWMPYEKGFGMASKAVGSAIGFKGAKSIGKLTTGRPRFSKYTKHQYRANQDINPNLSF